MSTSSPLPLGRLWLYALGLTLAFKLLYQFGGLAAYGLLEQLGYLNTGKFHHWLAFQLAWGVPTEPHFYDMFCRWDCEWYLRIVRQGYPATDFTSPDYRIHHSNHAFFPFLPLQIHLVMFLTGLQAPWAALLVSCVNTTAALAGLYRLVETLYAPGLARATVAVLLAFPLNHHLHMIYPEAFFLAALTWGLWGVVRRKWGLVLLLGVALGLTRPNGFVAGFSFLLLYLERYGWPHPRSLVGRHAAVWALTGPLLGYLAQNTYLYTRTGDFFAQMTAMQAWAANVLKKPMLEFVFYHSDWYIQLMSWAVVVYLLAALSTFLAPIRWGWKLHWLMWTGLLLPLFIGNTVLSIQRYMQVVFPWMLSLGYWLLRLPRWGQLGLFALGLVVQVMLLPLWLEQWWLL